MNGPAVVFVSRAATDRVITTSASSTSRVPTTASATRLRPSQIPVRPDVSPAPVTPCACRECEAGQPCQGHIGKKLRIARRPSAVPLSETGAPQALAVVDSGGGRPLDGGIRAEIEARLGGDFSSVRVHSDEAAARSAAGIQARAYTVRNPVVFGADAHAPENAEGQRTLVHELPRMQRVSRQPEDRVDAAPPSVQSVLASPGRPLEPAARQDMEQRFGHDFSRVRVHSGPAAEQSAQDVNALAYTVGHHIVFAAGQLAPETQQGRRLIAHELAHVVQQHASQPFVQRQLAPVGPPPPDPFGDVMDQLGIVREFQLPLEFFRRPEIRKLSLSERVQMQFQRKLVAIGKLGELKWEVTVPTLIQVLEDKIPAIQSFDPDQKLLLQQEAAASLAKIGGPKALAKLNDLLNSKDPKERLMASRGYSAAGGVGGQAVTDLIAALKKETDTRIRSQIIFALGNIGGASATSSQQKELIAKELIREMENSSGDVQIDAVTALGKVKSKSATPALLNQLRQHLGITRFAWEVIVTLGEIQDDRAVDLLVIMLEKHGSEEVRSEAAIALGKIGGSKGRAALKRRLREEPNGKVRAAISKAIRTLPDIIDWEFKPTR
jgi:HEAT repeat protein